MEYSRNEKRLRLRGGTDGNAYDVQSGLADCTTRQAESGDFLEVPRTDFSLIRRERFWSSAQPRVENVSYTPLIDADCGSLALDSTDQNETSNIYCDLQTRSAVCAMWVPVVAELNLTVSYGSGIDL